MRKQKRRLLFKLSALLLTIFFTAQSCGIGGGGNKQQRVELVWWKPFDSAAVVLPVVQEFQKKYPHIQIKYVEKNIETYEDELLNALAAGEGPDVFSIHNDWLPKYQDKMTPAPDGTMSMRTLREDFVQVLESDFVIGEKIYAIPLAIDVLALYYNKDMLASVGIVNPPQTWEDLVKMTEKLTQLDPLGNFNRSAVAMGTADNINRSADILQLLMLQNGTEFYNANRTSSALGQSIRGADGETKVPAASALEFYTQFANPSKETYTWSARSNNSIEAFVNRQVAMIFSYSYLRPQLREKAPFLNYGVASIPQISQSGNRVNFANYWGEGVSKQTKKSKEAWQFVTFLSSREVGEKYSEVQKAPSARKDLLEKQISDPEIGAFAENALSAKSVYEPDSDAVERVFIQMIEDVVLSHLSLQEAVQSATRKINLLLK